MSRGKRDSGERKRRRWSKVRQLRREMDSLNRNLVRLFLRRIDLAERIAREKAAMDLPLLDRRREREMLQSAAQRGPARRRRAARAFLLECFALTKRHL